MSAEKRIKIIDAYQHPRTSVLIVHFQFDDGFRSNMNVPPTMIEGLTKDQIKDVVRRQLEQIYERRKRMDAAAKQNLQNAADELKGLEIV